MTPLLALTDAESYVAGAYLVFVVLLLVYLAIMAAKLGRIQSELRRLAVMAEDDWKPKAEAEAEEVSPR